ncbi:MAG: PDZ domain-containing protein [Acidobacteria bacterium]|nr:PDZ domain-containing protein [Acidobacteriota bacterium]MBA3888778.1 PDZ domain-containing protein [Acidobacteriota bacterium]
MSTRKSTLFYAFLISIASIAVGMVIASRLELAPTSSAQQMAVPAMNSAPLGGPIDATTFRNIAQAQVPTVVNIQTSGRARTRELSEFFGGGEGDDLLRRFFGGQTPQQRRAPRGEAPPTAGAGTGFVVDKAGFILTNNHVVEGADVIRVSLFGGGRTESYPAQIVGRDVLTDSALLQLTEMPSTPLQEVRFGDSSQMQPGDWVVAIGNPFGLAHTVTVGVISALERTLPGSGVQGREQPMLQTDAAINPGNSGGPLMNVRGEVVGMNTAIFTDAQRAANIGIGFATPINLIRDLLPQLRAGKVVRGMIGVGLRPDPISREEANAWGLPGGTGALVTTINEGDPAARAGMELGDVVVEYNGQPVTRNDALISMVITTKPGTTVPVTVMRDQKRVTLKVTVDELDLDAERAGRPGGPAPDEPTTTGFGMTLEPITPEIGRQLNLPGGRGGAVVSSVEPRSPAANGGMIPGDVILEVNRQPVTNISQVTRALEGVSPGTPVSLVVWRGNQQIFVVITRR